MPFRSVAQQRFLFANHPEVAKRWAAESGVPKGLPFHVKKKARPKRVGLHRFLGT